ncbi:MAG: ABC transporter ATP-binding protein, partial [bacterium]|nr:ABC transporter ATP-binding protein [bacterium]
PEAKKLWYFMWILSTPQAVREMRIFGAKDALLGRFKKIQEHLLALNKQPLDNYVRFLTFPSLFEAVTLFFVAVFNLPAVLSGVMTVGSFTLLINMVYRLSYDTGSMVITFGDMYAASLYVDHYFEVMELPRLVSEPPNPVIFKKVLPPKIEFRDVYFSYPNTNKEVLNSVSFTINPGENAAFVGENGAGKSTIVKLLCRFYDPTKGEILINDVNLKELSLPNWYEFLGTLFQDFVQYHFSVTDNITFGNPYKFDPSTRATVDSRGLAQDSAPRINREEPDSAAGLHDKAVCEAARKAGATEFIEKLPKGFSTMLGREFEEGEELSIGQWQKLAIARAFYEEAPVLILDEPTSAIDAEGEYEIFRNLQKAYSSKTLILVSHRFSTVRRADKIFVVEAGKIAEEGKHEELIKLDGKYAKMFKTQAKGYE